MKRLADAGGCSLRELDRIAGRREGHAHALASGIITSPETETIASYATALGISRAWLAFGEGDPPTDDAIRAAVDAARGRIAAPTDADDPTRISQVA